MHYDTGINLHGPGRSNQIASNSVCKERGPLPINLFCSLIVMSSLSEIQ